MIQIQVGILKRVLEEVEKIMHEFKSTLYKSMEDPQIDITNVSLLDENNLVCMRVCISNFMSTCVHVVLPLDPFKHFAFFRILTCC